VQSGTFVVIERADELGRGAENAGPGAENPRSSPKDAITGGRLRDDIVGGEVGIKPERVRRAGVAWALGGSERGAESQRRRASCGRSDRGSWCTGRAARSCGGVGSEFADDGHGAISATVATRTTVAAPDWIAAMAHLVVSGQAVEAAVR
jgi:hypothetical protein